MLAGDFGIAYGGIADDSVSSTNSGLLVAIDTTTQTVSPLNNSFLTSDVGIDWCRLYSRRPAVRNHRRCSRF